MVVISWAMAAVLAALAAVHIYWALGGRRGVLAAIPEVNGARLFHPGPGVTLLVAGLLVVATILVLGRAGAVHWLPSALSRVGTSGVAVAFTGRAIGDCRYVGFLKRHRESRFARLDTRFYSPLAFALGVAAGVIAWVGG
jgi:hypothetical protein